jgi:hypothetical protein
MNVPHHGHPYCRHNLLVNATIPPLYSTGYIIVVVMLPRSNLSDCHLRLVAGLIPSRSRRPDRIVFNGH